MGRNKFGGVVRINIQKRKKRQYQAQKPASEDGVYCFETMSSFGQGALLTLQPEPSARNMPFIPCQGGLISLRDVSCDVKLGCRLHFTSRGKRSFVIETRVNGKPMNELRFDLSSALKSDNRSITFRVDLKKGDQISWPTFCYGYVKDAERDISCSDHCYQMVGSIQMKEFFHVREE